jgi:hypothetical protein
MYEFDDELINKDLVFGQNSNSEYMNHLIQCLMKINRVIKQCSTDIPNDKNMLELILEELTQTNKPNTF